ncbi:hypothetical protein [Streptomyces millisiae]|nr:hypothetical protein [Streptomyces sp. DSM 44918]
MSSSSAQPTRSASVIPSVGWARSEWGRVVADAADLLDQAQQTVEFDDAAERRENLAGERSVGLGHVTS